MPNFIKIIHIQVVITENSVPIVSLYLWFLRNIKANSVFTNLDLNLAEFVIRDPLINATRFLESINFVQGEKREREEQLSPTSCPLFCECVLAFAFVLHVVLQNKFLNTQLQDILPILH